jgi:prepilin-type N-terminal cleavage/methylation domain-containing protein
MIERLQQKRNSEEGFTLVELLVVIVILGILAAIVVFAVGGITDKGESSANKTDVAVLQAAEEAQYAQTKVNARYIGEQALVDGKFLRSLSEKNDICLASGGSNYEVVPAGTACSSGFTLAP